MAWSIALLIGFILGWGTCMLLDYLFWRKKRICSPAEDELQTIINRLEVEKGSLQAQVAKLTDTAEVKAIEVATLRSRIRESDIERTVTKTGNRAKIIAENAKPGDSYAPTAKIKIDLEDKETGFADHKPNAYTAKVELTDEARAIEVDLPATGVQDMTEQGIEDTDIANQSSAAGRSKDELTIEAAVYAAKPAGKDIKPASQHNPLPNHENNLADSHSERKHQAHEMTSAPSEVEYQRIQSSEATNKSPVLPSHTQVNLQIDAVAAGTDSNAVAVTSKRKSAPADNLTRIWGIGKNKQKALNEAGIYTFKQLAATPLAELDQLVAKGGDHFKLANQTTWSEQAQLAASKQWEDLHVLQEKLKAKLLQETGGFTLRDNLKEIWGIGKSKHRALYKAGFHIYKQLATTPVSYFDKFVDQRRDHFNLANQKTWPEQARLAASEQWGTLRVLQNKLRADYRVGRDDLRVIWGIGKKKLGVLGRSGIFTFEQLAATPVSDLDELVSKDRNQFNLTNQATWPEQAWLAAKERWGELHALQNKLMSEVMPELAVDSRDHRDNLREIWGIGKKKQRALNDAGILTFEQLLARAELDLDELLAQGRSDFNLANQSTWSEQAELAVNQQWGKLRALQKKLKAEERGRRDDLRLIWGIGKKKQMALYRVGIYTFEQLATTPISDFDVLVAKGSGVFNLANQPTWPVQARLASGGDWRALRGYQQVLARTYQALSDRMNRPNQDQTPQ